MSNARRCLGGWRCWRWVVTSMMTPKLVRRLSVIGFLAAFVSIALLPQFGTDFGKGAVRWYSLGFASIQPSEFLKPGFVVVSAWMLAASQEINGPPGRFWSLVLMMVCCGMLIFQPDFGQACIVFFRLGGDVFCGGCPDGAAFGAGWAGGGHRGCAPMGTPSILPAGLTGFSSPDFDPTSQLGYATNAIREGGILGVGVGEGQVKWSLPDAHTDFIIAVAAEEFGLIMVLIIIALYMSIVVRTLLRLMRERDPFIRLAGTGLACIFGIQAFINLGVAVRLLPAKGMTLPFVSYGGSSLIAGGIAVGMLLAFTRTRAQGEIGDLLRARVR